MNEWFVIPSQEELQAYIQTLNPENSSEAGLLSELTNRYLYRQPFFESSSSLQAVSVLPLRAESFLSNLLPASFRQTDAGVVCSHCEECGCLLHVNTEHCRKCHYDYDPALFPHHACRPLPPTHPLLGQCKYALLVIEMSLYGHLIMKRMRNLWLPARRAAWEMKGMRRKELFISSTCSKPK